MPAPRGTRFPTSSDAQVTRPLPPRQRSDRHERGTLVACELCSVRSGLGSAAVRSSALPLWAGRRSRGRSRSPQQPLGRLFRTARGTGFRPTQSFAHPREDGERGRRVVGLSHTLPSAPVRGPRVSVSRLAMKLPSPFAGNLGVQ